MNAEEVYKIVSERQDKHEEKCDQRQKRLHEKIDALEKHVYIGLGVFTMLNVLVIAFGTRL